MTIYPSLTISLLNQLSDRELQTNYLNHVDRTSEIASLLATISDQDLVLRIINLVYLLHFSDKYAYKSPNNPDYNLVEVSSLCCKAIAALERFGGDLAFEVLHQFAYWSIYKDYPSPFNSIIEALFRLDRDRTFTALEGAIHSYDPLVRKRAAMAFKVLDAPITERTFSILLSVIHLSRYFSK
jgi:hypothetical protein